MAQLFTMSIAGESNWKIAGLYFIKDERHTNGNCRSIFRPGAMEIGARSAGLSYLMGHVPFWWGRFFCFILVRGVAVQRRMDVITILSRHCYALVCVKRPAERPGRWWLYCCWQLLVPLRGRLVLLTIPLLFWAQEALCRCSIIWAARVCVCGRVCVRPKCACTQSLFS